MAQSTVHRLTSLVLLLAVTSSAKEQGSRWSRQISSYTSDIGDWVPLSGPVEREPPLPPIKRQAVAEPRILTEPFPGVPRPSGFGSDMFPARTYFNAPANRQLYLQSVPAVPSAPQNYLTDQGFGQSIRFGLSQPNFPLNQGFISPQFGYENLPQSVPQTVSQIKSKPQIQPPSNQVKFETFQKNTPLQVPMQIPVKSFNSQLPKTRPEGPKYVDGYRAEEKKPQSLQKIKFESFEKPIARPEVSQSIQKNQQGNQKSEREEVQLLYVPLESLNRGSFNFRSPLTSTSQLLNTDLYSQGVPPISHKKTITELHRPIQKIENSPQNYFTEFNSQLHSLQQKDLDQVPKYSTLTSPFPTSPPTTPKPKKLKPHQPPLAIFLTEEASRNNQIKVGDVLASLKTQSSVAVLDSVNPLNAPKVFIGPSSLQPPERYVKFELPYLSNIENSDKKLRQLPFFVAPLSYNTPQGFAKIPFPSPHVGSVVINSQIKDTTTQVSSSENVQPSYYTGTYRQQEPSQQKSATQKPTVSFYTTSAPKTPPTYQSNYYQFEPQTVSTLRPLKEPETVAPLRPPGNYFLNNAAPPYNTQYNAQYEPLAPQSNYQKPQPEPVKSYTIPKQETTTTLRPTVITTTKLPTTYPSQLLETHNPYSINQAFHFSTPLDYRPYVDEYKEPVAADPLSTPQRPVSTTSQTPKIEEVVTEQQRYQQTSPQYQSYSPEIHYESEVQNSRYPIYNTNDYSKTETAESYSPVQNENTEYNPPPTNPTEYTNNQETQAPVQSETPAEEENKPTVSEIENPSRYEYNQYETSFNSNEGQTSSTSSTSTTTTSTRRPLRGRGRPRYTTTPRADSNEYYTRATRKPLRERRPLPPRPKYEPNKITSEKPTKKPIDYSEESTTKSIRTRQRGRVTFKPTEEIYDRRKTHNTKEQDLAYQRDVLHQNYPVTIQERHSTVDIEAMTEPTIKLSSNKDFEPATETYDTENAYTYERASITQQNANPESDEDIPVLTTRTTVSQTETSYVPRVSNRNEEYIYQSRSSEAPAESISYTETPIEKEEESYPKQTTLVQREPESVAFATEPTSYINENKEQTFSENEENQNKEFKEETTTTMPEVEVTKVSQETEEEEEEENVVQTTPSYNRVRVRPGVIKQYHQASTESSRIKLDRRRPVTYRPAFDRRRTTMRIDEIQQDLKTKQVHGRPENDEYRHPVYKPESSSEATSTQEVTTKRGIRRRRPNYSYTTSTTEGSPVRKNTYDLKNRFRSRRPTTEKPTEKTDVSIESTTTTVRPLYSRYSHRPRLSERYNKKPEPEPTEETEDQDPNFSINRPTYTEPDTKWSPKIASDSFKPYNPNNIVDEEKIATTERRSDKIETDIITARNEYDDVLISVTPATNNRNNKKIPEIPPTLEALVEQSKVTKSDANDNMSTFESMLEEVMKSLEEQDEDEYTTNVMKHKGGEIGEIPPERIISSEDSNMKTTSPIALEASTLAPTTAEDSTTNEEEFDRNTRRRGFWKKVKVRPVATESIEAAESQYYTNTVNVLGESLNPKLNEKSKYEKKVSVTTYKPTFQFMKDIFSSDDVTANENIVPTVEISKVNAKSVTDENDEAKETKMTTEKENQTEKTEVSPGDFDLGTGTPDPTIDNLYTTEPTTAQTEKQFSLMDYLFGTTSEEDTKDAKNDTTTQMQVEISTESGKTKIPTTETAFIPDEITDSLTGEVTEIAEDIKKVTEKPKVTSTASPKIESTSQSSFMNPTNVISTSMSTEISHETEICFRGKCIKTFKDVQV